MIGLPVGVVGESQLRELIKSVIAEIKGDPMGKKAFAYELMRSQEGDDEDEEISVSANVAGYSLPLGASNHPSTLQSRGDFTARMYGGERVRNLKLRRMKNPK